MRHVSLIWLFLSSVCLCSGDPTELLPKAGAWTVEGSFSHAGVFPTTSNAPLREFPKIETWGSWTGNENATGTLISPPFPAPAILKLFVAGYPSHEGTSIVLQRPDTTQTLPLNVPRALDPSERWREMYWVIPYHWRGNTVRLITTDKSVGFQGWVGVSSPMSGDLPRIIQQQAHDLLLFIAYSLDFLIFFLPGLAAGCLGARRHQVSLVNLLILITLVSAALGYVAFYVYLASKLAGVILSYTVLGVSLVLLVLNLIRHSRVRLSMRTVALPFSLAYLVGAFYLAVFYVATDPFIVGSDYADVLFFHQTLPGDNIIPLIFADKFYDHHPLHPFCCGDWLSSDRPPLQSGIYLLQRPLKLLGPAGLNYQLLGTALQCTWILGIWTLLTSLQVPHQRIYQVIGLLVFSGFVSFNSVYVWPKLLAATFLLFLWSIALGILCERRVLTLFELALAALSFGLATMAHPGSLFSVPALFLLVVFRLRQAIPVKSLLLAAALMLVVILPWTAYQTFYDPPGNRLPKLHLAGVSIVDSRTTWEAVRDAYSHTSVAMIFEYKWRNIKTLVGPRPTDGLGINTARDLLGFKTPGHNLETERLAQHDYLWNALGVLNIGWIVGLSLLVSHRKPVLPQTGLLLLCSLFNLLLWACTFYFPEFTITAHCSYVEIFFLSITSISFLLTLPRVVTIGIYLLQIFVFWIVWIYSLPTNFSQPTQGINPVLQIPLMLVAGFLGLSLLMIFGRSFLLPAHPNQRESH